MAKATPAKPSKAPAKANTPPAGASTTPKAANSWRKAPSTPDEVAQAIDASLAGKLANVAGAKASKKAATINKDVESPTEKGAKVTSKRGVSTNHTEKSVKSGAKDAANVTNASRAGAHERKNKPHVSIDEAMIAKILAEVAEGKSLHKVCRGDEMPDRVCVLAKFNGTPEMRQRWEAAMEARAHKHAEEIIEIADDGSNDTYVDADGMVKVDHDVVARSKLRIDARKWYASKLSPKYSDRVDVNHGVQPDNPMLSLLAQVSGTALGIKGNDE